jgi:xanthine dehydrogenase YagS FAD-binding subunit
MHAFEYARPATIKEAVQLLANANGEAEVLAGGTDLLDLMKNGVDHPVRLVSLGHINELKGIEFSSGSGLRLGATVALEELIGNANVQTHYPALVQALESVSSPQIRSRGTVGGDLCQRPRCWYYRLGYGLLALYNGKPLIPDGDNRYHAILGNAGPAYFVSPSSLGPILIGLDATVQLHGPQGSRTLPAADFFVTPKKEGELEHALRPHEIVTQIQVPPPGGTRMAVYAVRQKEALDWPLSVAAVALDLDGDTVKTAKVVLGQVAPIPWRSPEAEATLAGKTLTEDTAWEAGKAAVSKANALSKNGYKVQLTRVAVKRALLRAAKGEA